MNRDEPLGADPLTKLRESDLHADPIVQFQRWLEQATLSGVCKPTAMTLATSSPGGLPSARIVLLRDADESGFTFFTNYEGPKARDLEANPHAALLFYWAELERQIRIEGTVSRLSAAESDAHYRGRTRESRLGAWLSPQSEVVPNEAVLEHRWRGLEREHTWENDARPPFWGGYRVEPRTIEFWQARLSRLHDRLRYRRVANTWSIERMMP
jgi:pyridoxamine 5'-phosphate oxidase